MKGILKIYHPEETLKYHIQWTYCKAVYINSQHFLEVEMITDDSLDHVDDDSLLYNYPQLLLKVSDFPTPDAELSAQYFKVEDTEDEIYTEIDLYDDEDAYLYDSNLSFDHDEAGELQLCWTWNVDDFYTGSDDLIPFKLKCHYRPD